MLDEPTNHLDHESVDALIIALNNFEGAVIVVSHDRHLVDSVADEIWEVSFFYIYFCLVYLNCGIVLMSVKGISGQSEEI